MNLSKKWLLDYIDLNVDDKTFSDEMTLSGSKVEGYAKEGADLTNIVVGKLLSLEKHPDSDHLWICQIDAGQGDPLQIVTGAQNLKEGDFVPVALDHSTVHGGKQIKKGKLRGVPSNGMLCSLGELGLTTHDFPYAIEDGIFVLGDDCDLTPGADIHDAIGLNDTVTEFEITSNRPDCLSVLGLAREAAATFQVPFQMPVPQVKPTAGNVNDHLSVTILDAERCYRYVGAIVENVRIKPSPRWLRERLRASGVRPINNIVDITNFVMLEYGQPMHAFDLRYLEGNSVIVRRAENGERITTLDGIERTLTDDMLVIADAKKPVAVAGVMGGEYSGIMEDTTTIVFESACFNGASVRRTAKKLGMRTEASSRYEKELSPVSCPVCLARALELVQRLDAGDVVNGVVDCDRSKKEQRTLPFDWQWVNHFIGIEVGPEEQKAILERIGFRVENGTIYVPPFRNDIEHKADISEEIARFYGYGNIPNRMLTGVANAKLTPMQQLERLIHSTLLGCGLSEVSTYSFISPKAYDRVRLPAESEKRKSVVITNPLGEDTSVMRTTALPSILDVLSRNYNNRNPQAAIYELAVEYTPRGTQELPLEQPKAAIGMYGDGCDFYALKGVVEELLKACGLVDYDVEAVTDDPTFHPGRTARIMKESREVAFLGEIHPQVQENYGLGMKAYAAEVDVAALMELGNRQKVYHPLPKFPASTRDIAVVCARETPVLTLERVIGEAIGAILEEISLFDVYEGKQIEAGKKSAAFSLRLRAADRTLTDEEADAAMKRAVKALAKIGATLRA